MKSKIIVRYIGGGYPSTDKMIWGGTLATNYAIKRAFENDPEIDLQMKVRKDFSSIREINDFLAKKICRDLGVREIIN